VPGDLTEVEFIEKDSQRFSDTHGWGSAISDFDSRISYGIITRIQALRRSFVVLPGRPSEVI
jgi:hypothetical protein